MSGAANRKARARNVVCMRDVADQLVAPALLEVCCCLLIRCAVMPCLLDLTSSSPPEEHDCK